MRAKIIISNEIFEDFYAYARDNELTLTMLNSFCETWHYSCTYTWSCLKIHMVWVLEIRAEFLPHSAVIPASDHDFLGSESDFQCFLWVYHRKKCCERVCIPQKSLAIARDFWHTNSFGWMPFCDSCIVKLLTPRRIKCRAQMNSMSNSLVYDSTAPELGPSVPTYPWALRQRNPPDHF